MTLQSPYPYFGGKSRVASTVWRRFGSIKNYVEPFFGSGAVLLGRPGWYNGVDWQETVNDKDGFITNFWRSVKHNPELTASYAENPRFESDLHARHMWLVSQKESMTLKLEGSPDWFDSKIAGWWCWGLCIHIGGKWCSGDGPWVVKDGELVNDHGLTSPGITRSRISIGTSTGVERDENIEEWFKLLSSRFETVNVLSGDWSRAVTETPTTLQGVTGVFLDPPYSLEAGRADDLYAVEDLDIAHDVARWCRDNQANQLLRIALCGYDVEHDLPGWSAFGWKGSAGYSKPGSPSKTNSAREMIWFSPSCINDDQPGLFDEPHEEEPVVQTVVVSRPRRSGNIFNESGFCIVCMGSGRTYKGRDKVGVTCELCGGAGTSDVYQAQAQQRLF